MGPRPRVLVPGFPHHVVQRGHDRNAVFVETSDYEFYLANLIKWKSHYDVGVYAYCLMTNHVHLILVPYSDGNDISNLMHRLAMRQGLRANRLEQREGTLWSGRFKSSVIDTNRYLLSCLRYVELNPVHARIVRRPEDYRWSSYAQRLGLKDENWLDPDPVTSALGSTTTETRRVYADFVGNGISAAERKFLGDAVSRNRLTGDSAFVDEIERRTGLRVEARTRGRPKK